MKTGLGLKAGLAQDADLLMISSSSPMTSAHGLGVAGGDGAFCSVRRFEGIPENGKPENHQNNTNTCKTFFTTMASKSRECLVASTTPSVAGKRGTAVDGGRLSLRSKTERIRDSARASRRMLEERCKTMQRGADERGMMELEQARVGARATRPTSSTIVPLVLAEGMFLKHEKADMLYVNGVDELGEWRVSVATPPKIQLYRPWNATSIFPGAIDRTCGQDGNMRKCVRHRFETKKDGKPFQQIKGLSRSQNNRPRSRSTEHSHRRYLGSH